MTKYPSYPAKNGSEINRKMLPVKQPLKLLPLPRQAVGYAFFTTSNFYQRVEQEAG